MRFLFLFGMTISITFAQEVMILGITQDAGYPQADCQKDCCGKVHEGKAKKQLVASLAVSDGLQFFIIDATPDFTAQLKLAQEKFPNQKLGGIFLTHAHIGHYTGLMYLGREGMNASHVKVYVMPRMKTFIESNGPWSQLVVLGNIDLVKLKGDSTVKLSPTLSITPVRVPHRDEFSETVGFYLKGTTKTLLYIPDIDKWSNWDSDIVKVLAKVDHALLDGTFFDEKELPGRDISEIPHPLVIESLESLKSLDDETRAKIWFIHFNHTNKLLDSESEESKAVENSGLHLARQEVAFNLG